ncbi:MAG: DUF4097 family beta strand repeat-containing protein [Gemmatimonadaceae bacterium]
MMRRSIVFALTLATNAFVMHALATVADAQQAVSRGWALNAEGAVKVHGDAGSIRIIGWERDSVTVTGTVATASRFFSGGDRNGVKMGIETNSGPSKPSDLVVHVPARARVWVRSASANIDVSTFSGELDISTVGGTVHIRSTPTELRAESMNGTLDVTASPAYLRLKSATGAIRWNGSSDDVGIITVSGRVVVNASTVHRARVESIDGDIRLAAGFAVKSTLEIDTHSGNVTLAVSKGSSATFEVSARGCELFGARQGQDRAFTTALPPRNFYSSIGQLMLGKPSIVVRSYKGYVTATTQ